MPRIPQPQNGGQWKVEAFPSEAKLNFDEISVEEVQAAKAKAEAKLDGLELELIDGIDFPYDQYA